MLLLISTEKNSHFSVVIGSSAGIVGFKTVRKKYQQSELLLESISRLISRHEMDGIMVVEGPGDFSALRIGIGTANALAYAWSLPLVGIKLKTSWLTLTEKEKIDMVWEQGIELLQKKKKQKINFVLPEYDRVPNINLGKK